MALISGRAVQGVGGAGVINGAFAVIAAAASPQSRPRESMLCYTTFYLGS
jgi:MFS family permease